MSPRTATNKKLKSALIAAGFTVTTPDTDPLAGIAWTVRRNMHRYMAGQALTDYRDAIQFGTDEVNTRLWKTRPFINGIKLMVPLPTHITNAVWICGPGAAWVATGTAPLMMKLKEELNKLFPDEVAP